MAYTLDERIDIGRQVVTQELTRREAMQKYQIGSSTIDNYERLYKEKAGIPTRKYIHAQNGSGANRITVSDPSIPDIDTYMAMSKEELINELIRAKANELRAKKGYEVKGAGANKEFIPLNRPNSKS